MGADAADHLVPEPVEGRVHRSSARARIGDCGPDGLVRLDGVARLLQDVASEDTADLDLPDVGGWVVRRTLVEVGRAAALHEGLEVRTFCGGLGRRWAERRTSVRGERGAAVEAASLWVHVDPTTGRPVPLPESFLAVHRPAAGGRQVGARLRHGTEVPAHAARLGWSVRVADLDVVGHVNNAVGWSVVEEVLAAAGPATGGARRLRAAVEHLRSLEHGDQVGVAWWREPTGGVAVVVADAEDLDRVAADGGSLPPGSVRLTARVAPLPG